MPEYNLLSQPLLTVRTRDGRRRKLTLPQLFSNLGGGEELEPLALRPHQEHAWYAFLVQIGALVAHHTGKRPPNLVAEEWGKALCDLAGDAGETAWTLVVSDLSRPACLQPAVPEGSLAGFKPMNDPDQVDVVITARNHDVKAERIARAAPEHWFYALLTLQTMQGYLGRYYGIARMNGGTASRPAVCTAPGLRWPARFERDIGVWLDARQTLIDQYGYRHTGGNALLWLLPWDGTSSHSLQDCDPFFVEVCRRIRLQNVDGRILARIRRTEMSFLAAKDQHGDTGDVWTPVRADPSGTSALTVTGGGFSYRLMTKLLMSGDYRPGPALRLRDEDGTEPVVVAQVLMRGEGKTEGYHQRWIPVPAKARRRLLAAGGDEDLRAMASHRVEQAAKAQRQVLHPALCSLLQGGPDALDLRDPRTDPWLRRFDSDVDQVFFPDLWEAVGLPREDHENDWNNRLRTLAFVQLEHAVASASVPMAQRPRAVARAELRFRSASRRHLPTSQRESNPEEARP